MASRGHRARIAVLRLHRDGRESRWAGAATAVAAPVAVLVLTGASTPAGRGVLLGAVRAALDEVRPRLLDLTPA